jgi:regulator of protease activity HflC (stomatin/prohibitin superfamily)
MLYQTVTITEAQLGLVTRRGRYQRLLTAGTYRLLALGGLAVELIELQRRPLASPALELLARTRPAEIEPHVLTVDTGDGEAALVSADGKLVDLVGPGQRRLYARALQAMTVERLDLRQVLQVREELLAPLQRIATRGQLLTVLVGQRQQGLLYVDGVLQGTLGPGLYGYLTLLRQVQVVTLDLRLQTLEVQGQEILTRDRVGLRANLTALYRVTDPVTALAVVSDVKDYLYKELQLILRQVIGQRTLEQVLGDKTSIDEELATLIAAKAATVGVEVAAVGLKDVILPGDMRLLMNRVIEAEKTAQANVIKRREETAATRSLLATAQLMQDNPLLLRLKELEALEKIAERVGTLRVSDGLEGLLKLVTLKPDKAA